eukprot:CAMPEP_0172473184 /NCGR_PEP_ID=MMETSP1065-20121228/68726_1 /TAXON_ID=265537 /ORGANISM="Amphiprora paludosa, Strain CCMP125" /LENGTH=272 /DNA_ID=CAMNT_0013231353 /DNA_START=45 /DNA_END=860 /DNA_ORIENTATION=+
MKRPAPSISTLRRAAIWPCLFLAFLSQLSTPVQAQYAAASDTASDAVQTVTAFTYEPNSATCSNSDITLSTTKVTCDNGQTECTLGSDVYLQADVSLAGIAPTTVDVAVKVCWMKFFGNPIMCRSIGSTATSQSVCNGLLTYIDGSNGSGGLNGCPGTGNYQVSWQGTIPGKSSRNLLSGYNVHVVATLVDSDTQQEYTTCQATLEAVKASWNGAMAAAVAGIALLAWQCVKRRRQRTAAVETNGDFVEMTDASAKTTSTSPSDNGARLGAW